MSSAHLPRQVHMANNVLWHTTMSLVKLASG
jgi:hypothetical protein